MKFIHTADLHLGKSFKGIGDIGELLREAQLNALGRIVELAREEQADFVVIAGELFDSNEVTGRLVKKVVEQLSRLAPVPVLILPGTHDLLDEGSVYERSEFRDAENIKIFGIDGISISVGDVAIHGRANDTKQGGAHPLNELTPDPGAAFNVAVVHASMEIEGKSSPDDYLVSPSEIASCGMDYVALGHWHGRSEFSSCGVVAWYSGAPEPTKFDEAKGAGFVNMVESVEGKVDVRPHQTRQYTWLEKDMELSEHPPGGALESEIRTLAGDDILLKVNLKGVIPKGQELDLEALEEELGESFLYLKIRDAGIGFPLQEVESLFAEGTVGSMYVARLRELIEVAGSDEEKALLEEALYLGASYIAGVLEVG